MFIMKLSILLPHSFKKIGVIIAPFGLVIWCLTQLNQFDTILVNQNTGLFWPKVLVLSASFFCFLFGMYFLVFAKEKVEDEYIKNIRLKSFQAASFLQFMFFIISFIVMFVFNNEPKGDGGLEIYLISCILLYWLFYIVFFNVSIFISKLRINAE